MYVGKNNIQNDELTFKFANGGDMWFHAKKMPGSHVIVRLEGAGELPDSTYEEAARLAAYYSSGRTGTEGGDRLYRAQKYQKACGGKAWICNISYELLDDCRAEDCGNRGSTINNLIFKQV